jgi:hypothetical protein
LTTRVLHLTRPDVVSRALSHLVLVSSRHRLSPLDFAPAPVAYRNDNSGRLGGDDPEASNCADWSFSYRTLTADCVGFALYCAGISRRQPGFKGLNGEWLNTDSIIADAERGMFFFRPVLSGEAAKPGDLLVSKSTFVLGRRVKDGHVGVIIRPAPAPGFDDLVVDCSPRHGRTTAIGVGTAWSRSCVRVRPLFYKETE